MQTESEPKKASSDETSVVTPVEDSKVSPFSKQYTYQRHYAAASTVGRWLLFYANPIVATVS